MEFNKHWIACHAVCLCLFLRVVLAYRLHHGLLCCLGMLQSLRERSKNQNVRLPHWHREEEKMSSSSQQEQFNNLNRQPQQNMWGNHIQTLHLHFFHKTKTTPLGSLMFGLIQITGKGLKNSESWDSGCRVRVSVQVFRLYWIPLWFLCWKREKQTGERVIHTYIAHLLDGKLPWGDKVWSLFPTEVMELYYLWV